MRPHSTASGLKRQASSANDAAPTATATAPSVTAAPTAR